MKTPIIYLLVCLQFAHVGCHKEPIVNTAITTPPSPPPPPPPPSPPLPPGPTSATLINCNAGTDKLVFFPVNFCGFTPSLSLNGSLSALTFKWQKISGPSSFVIEHPDSLGTKVTNLEIGVYQFELAASDISGFTDRDTCSVIVGQLSSGNNEIVFENRTWSNSGLLWGSQINISNVYQYIPPGAVFKAYIKRDNSAIWEELILDDYHSYYFSGLMDGNFSLWSTYDETDTPNIKLVF